MRDNKAFKAGRSVVCVGMDAAIAREVTKLERKRGVETVHVIVSDASKVDFEIVKKWGTHCVEKGEGRVIAHCFDEATRRAAKKALRGSMDGKRFHTKLDRGGFEIRLGPAKAASFKRNLVVLTELGPDGEPKEEQTIVFQG